MKSALIALFICIPIHLTGFYMVKNCAFVESLMGEYGFGFTCGSIYMGVYSILTYSYPKKSWK